MQIKVTCILFSYNQECYIEEAISSMLNQDYINSEYIVIDDGSSDSSVSLIKKHLDKGHINFKFINVGMNKGLASAINLAVSEANGELIVFFAGDDISEVGRVTKIVDIWEETKSSAIFSNADMIDDNGNRVFTLYDSSKSSNFHFSLFIN
ncbi:glycosyltransferase, partial [Vibrio antiquarius]